MVLLTTVHSKVLWFLFFHLNPIKHIWCFQPSSTSRSSYTSNHPEVRSAPQHQTGVPACAGKHKTQHRLQQRGHLGAQQRRHRQHGRVWRAWVRPVPAVKRPHGEQWQAALQSRLFQHGLPPSSSRQRFDMEQGVIVCILAQQRKPTKTAH